MIDLRPDLLQIVTDLLELHVPGLEVRAFGSRVHWTAKEHSDLDLVIMSAKPLPLETLALLEEDLVESDLPIRVDVLDWATLEDHFRHIIEQEYEVLQAGSSADGSDTTVGSMDGKLPENWGRVLLSDLIDQGKAHLQTGPLSAALHASAYTAVGTPVVAVLNIGENRLTHDRLSRVNAETVQRLDRYRLQENDIVLGRKGAVDRRAWIRSNESGWLQGSDCLRLRLDEDTVSPQFVSYVLGLPAYRNWMLQRAPGASLPFLDQKILRLIPLPLPPLAEQRAIAAILGALDDKIELNRCMNRTLEDMAQALFKQRFVDGAEGVFHPFIQPIRLRILENTEQSRTLAALRDSLLPKLMSGELRIEDAWRGI